MTKPDKCNSLQSPRREARAGGLYTYGGKILIFKLGYQKAIVPEAMLPLITQITPIKSIGKVITPDDSVEVSVEVTKETLTVDADKVEQAQQEEYKTSRDMYQKLYSDQCNKIQQLEQRIKELTPTT